jgi:uncharacterized PurR-regulated membrane protein YhhQ (DUF165 family)
VSQLVDSIAVILITHFLASGLPLDESASVSWQIVAFIVSAYLFKLVVALLDTIPFYIGTHYLKRYLKVEKEILSP